MFDYDLDEAEKEQFEHDRRVMGLDVPTCLLPVLVEAGADEDEEDDYGV